MLEQIISQVYLPILTQIGARATESNEGDEVLASLRKFAEHLRRTTQHIEGEVTFTIPDDLDIAKLADVVRTVEDAPLMRRLEPAMASFVRTITSVLEGQLHATPSALGPVAELEFWVERNLVLTALHDQLQLDAVAAIRKVLASLDLEIVRTFDDKAQEVSRHYAEAKDNVKFLTTLERHFKNLEEWSSLTTITENLPSLMNAIRMVWIISRHYNTDQRMVPLMERVAWLLAEKVARRINTRTILRSVAMVAASVRAAPRVRVKVKITVNFAVCENPRQQHTAFLTVKLALTRPCRAALRWRQKLAPFILSFVLT